jgi:hypothetical protein
MENDRDLRNVILLLVKASKLYQARAYTANKVLTALMGLPPTNRAALTTEYVSSEATRIHSLCEEPVNKQAQRIEKALAGDGEFLEALRVYASEQLRNAS